MQNLDWNSACYTPSYPLFPFLCWWILHNVTFSQAYEYKEETCTCTDDLPLKLKHIGWHRLSVDLKYSFLSFSYHIMASYICIDIMLHITIDWFHCFPHYLPLYWRFRENSCTSNAVHRFPYLSFVYEQYRSICFMDWVIIWNHVVPFTFCIITWLFLLCVSLIYILSGTCILF